MTIASVSQAVIEALRTSTAVNVVVSQSVVEILRENGAEVPISSSSAQQIVVAT